MAKKHKEDLPPPGRPATRRWLMGAAVAAALFGAARLEFIRVLDVKNGNFLLARYQLMEESPDHPRLRLLREREKLDEVMAPGRSEFEKIVLLRKWAHGQWSGAPRFYYPPWDAVEILDLARARGNRGFCSQYAIVFLQACLSVGLHARYVDLGHFLTEVWSDEYNRWVVMDPTNDVHYERGGVPLRGRELSAASWSGNAAEIEAVDSAGKRTPVKPEDLKSWRAYSIVLRNNQLSEPEAIVHNGVRKRLTHQSDYRDYPLVGRDSIGWGDDFLIWRTADGRSESLNGERASGDPDDFRDVLNQTMIFVAVQDPKNGLAKLKLIAEHAPEFQSFLVRSGSRSYESPSEIIIWKLEPGMNVLAARVKTRFGWVGPESVIKVFYKPD